MNRKQNPETNQETYREQLVKLAAEGSAAIKVVDSIIELTKQRDAVSKVLTETKGAVEKADAKVSPETFPTNIEKLQEYYFQALEEVCLPLIKPMEGDSAETAEMRTMLRKIAEARHRLKWLKDEHMLTASPLLDECSRTGKFPVTFAGELILKNFKNVWGPSSFFSIINNKEASIDVGILKKVPISKQWAGIQFAELIGSLQFAREHQQKDVWTDDVNARGVSMQLSTEENATFKLILDLQSAGEFSRMIDAHFPRPGAFSELIRNHRRDKILKRAALSIGIKIFQGTGSLSIYEQKSRETDLFNSIIAQLFCREKGIKTLSGNEEAKREIKTRWSSLIYG